MKALKLLTVMSAVCLSTTVCFAHTQAYSHPTLFGTQAHTLVNADNNVVVGGKILKKQHKKAIQGKENVLIAKCGKDMLEKMKSKMDEKRGAMYNPKMPVLRSELAFMIAEGLGLKESNPSKYTDLIDNYWAKDEIEKALSADVMIGYPDLTFKPDQAITKAEVFATFAKLMDLTADKSTPKYNGKTVKYIPKWAYKATNEVIASGVLKFVPDQDKLINEEYLSKEQVAVFIMAMKKNFDIDFANGVVGCAKKYEPVAISIKLSERLSARVSNVGDTFSAKTTKEVTIGSKTFPAGSTVKGEITNVSRPGVKNPGFIQVKFNTIECDGVSLEFPNKLSSAQVETMKNPNIVSRLLGAPFSMVGRVAGVTGRSISQGAHIVANGVEEYAGNWSDAFVDTFSLHPLKGLKSVGSSFITVGKGVFNLSKLAVSGTFGVFYEFVDECKYLIVPNTTNDSSLNPDEELTIIY